MAKLFFYYSTMNAGKSTSLLQAAHNYDERGMTTLLFSLVDPVDPVQTMRIRSRIGIGKDAIGYGPGTDFWSMCTGSHPLPDCVLIDEAQFLSQDQVRQLARVVDEANIPVMCYGLRTDFRGDLFPGSAALLGWADTLSELKTICVCGRKATMVVRVDGNGKVEREGAQVEIGGNNRYVPLCRKHFSESVASGVCTGWRRG
jgi:thymidine kinase